MVSIVFILGRTGSGKSTTVRFLGEVAQSQRWSVQSFNDYFYLRDMYLADTAHRFRSTEHDGFEVLDRSVYEIAIRSLAQQVQNYYPENDRTLITIEFTSNNYREALQHFDDALLRDAHFIFISADLQICLERIRRRALHLFTKDDYYVIDSVLLSHYPSPYMPLYVFKKKVEFIHNMGSLEELKRRVQAYACTLLEQNVPVLAWQIEPKHESEKTALSITEKLSNFWGVFRLLNSAHFFTRRTVESSVESPNREFVGEIVNTQPSLSSTATANPTIS